MSLMLRREIHWCIENISQITLLSIFTNLCMQDSSVEGVTYPQFGLRWKIFELDGCDGAGKVRVTSILILESLWLKVCLVFPPKSEGAQVDEGGNIHLELSPPDPQVFHQEH